MKRFEPYKRVRHCKVQAKTMFPIIWCVTEDKCIGISKCKVKIGDKVKVCEEQWKLENSKFLLDAYRIDFSKLVYGEKVHCPVCGGAVDFRMFPSDVEPSFR